MELESSAPRLVTPGSFDSPSHFYPRVLNAQMHPLVRFFLSLGNERIAIRYCHMHPEVTPESVTELLSRRAHHFRWGGADLFHTTTEEGTRRIVVIETNSSPSGQKSMPLIQEEEEQAGYRRLLERSFMPALRSRGLPRGGLAVLFDKNLMEASAYAAVMADLADEPVWLVPFFAGDRDPHARFTEDGVLEVRDPDGQWQPIRGALRYVTQRPWTRIPPLPRTLIYNPVLVCLAGGRNKMLAAKAYDIFQGDIESTGLRINFPETMWNVSQEEVPIWVNRMGGYAVVKVPYSNAGQGVYTITSPQELQAFMDQEQPYDRFIVQALIGNSGWSSRSKNGRLYHVGTVPDRRGDIFVADLRCMVGIGSEGAFPVAIYARRARSPLAAQLNPDGSSWDMLGTNLSVKKGVDEWSTEPERLLLMDSRDFNKVGVGLDDLIEGYVQTVLAMTAIDRMSTQLVNSKGRFRRRMFGALNPDPTLLSEIIG